MWPRKGLNVLRLLGLLTTALGTSAPVVDLGYAEYQGYYNSTFDTHIYRGIRFAAPPERWQLPQPPKKGNDTVIQAVQDPPRCPQSPPATGTTPEAYDFAASGAGDEDCLFLNVFASASKKSLPVLVWIHGGGYGAGSASSFDFSYMSRTVGNGFMFVAIQYRLGAFGFASSAEIGHFGVPNAGLHDMHFALEWVQKYIRLFGGDPDQVTIAGESAGGGAVMLMAMANGGQDGSGLWRRGIAASPYLPTQWSYDDIQPSQSYYDLAERAGCLTPAVTQNSSVFECLQRLDSLTLQKASAYTSLTTKYGQWAFIPVTDGTLISARPSEQLLRGKVNGERMLAGNNANEGTYFVPQNITTRDQFASFIRLNYPLLSPRNLTSIMSLYQIPANATFARNSPGYDSDGLTPPYATSISNYAVGWQQAANNLYAETTFVCPAYWLADAYSADFNPDGKGKKAWRYQFSPPNAFHGSDMQPLLSDPATLGTKEDAAFRRTFQSIWGNLIVSGDPTVGLTGGGDGDGDAVSAANASSWKAWGKNYPLLNLNATNTEPYKARFEVVDGNTWEGGRGDRCALWARLGAVAQE